MKKSEVRSIYDSFNAGKYFNSALASDSVVAQATDTVSANVLTKVFDLNNRPSLGQVFVPTRANPHDHVRSKILHDTFTFAGEVHGQEDYGNLHLEDSINYDSSTMLSFIDSIVEKAEKLSVAAKSSLRQNGGEKAFFITGPKGVGKTHLQSYMISRYWKRLDRSKTIWVRLNLIRDFGKGNTDVDMLDWIKAQILKIVTRYYDNESDYLKRSSYSPKTDDRQRIELEEIRGKRDEEHNFDVEKILDDYISAKVTREAERDKLLERKRVLVNRLRVPGNDSSQRGHTLLATRLLKTRF